MQTSWRGRLARLQARRAQGADHDGGEEGFTLIELMVVLLIIAILLAIAIPTFLGVTNSANDRAAQSTASNAMQEARGVLGDNSQTYTGANFSSAAPEFSWSNDSGGTGTNLATAADPGHAISYWVGDAATSGDGLALILATYSKSTQTCWYIANLQATPLNPISGDSQSFVYTSGASTAGTYYASQKGTDCQASLAVDPFKWGPNWTTPGSNGTYSAPTTTTTSTAPPCGSVCIQSVSPSTASHDGGVTVTLTGTGFGSLGGCPPACSGWVTVGSSGFVSILSWSNTSVSFTLPAGSVGPATIHMATNQGGSGSFVGFSYS